MNLEKMKQSRIFFSLVKKEFKLLYRSPVLYAVVLFFILALGLFFIASDYWFNSGLADFKVFFLNMPILFCIIIPMLTMNVWSEEKKYFTDKLLFSFPVSFRLISLAKYVNLVFVWLLILLLSMFIPFSLLSLGNFSIGAFFISYLAVFFFGSGLISISLALSSISKYTAINFLSSFLIILFFTFFTSRIANAISSASLKSLFNYVSFTNHFETSARGIFSSIDFIFYLILILFGIELNVFILKLSKDAK